MNRINVGDIVKFKEDSDMNRLTSSQWRVTKIYYSDSGELRVIKVILTSEESKHIIKMEYSKLLQVARIVNKCMIEQEYYIGDEVTFGSTKNKLVSVKYDNKSSELIYKYEPIENEIKIDIIGGNEMGKMKTFWDYGKMEKLSTIQKRENLNEVYRVGEDGPGGAYHNYRIVSKDEYYPDGKKTDISFQCGPRNELESTCGVIDGDLLEIVRDRLTSFQAGPFNSEYNAKALEHIEIALMYLNRRVEDRIERNVLGENKK